MRVHSTRLFAPPDSTVTACVFYLIALVHLSTSLNTYLLMKTCEIKLRAINEQLTPGYFCRSTFHATCDPIIYFPSMLWWAHSFNNYPLPARELPRRIITVIYIYTCMHACIDQIQACTLPPSAPPTASLLDIFSPHLCLKVLHVFFHPKLSRHVIVLPLLFHDGPSV